MPFHSLHPSVLRERTAALIPVEPATDEDWSTEYLDYILSIKVVDGLDAAIDHINRYGSGHTDAIGIADREKAERFMSLVDTADYEELSKYKWSVTRKGTTVYASRRKGGRVVYMHREIMQPPKGSIVDHIDPNTLNNRRCNLRVCTPEQNQVNRGPRGGSSQFVGVYRRRDKWVAEIVWRGEYFYLGLFDDEVEAAKARDRKAYEFHGPYAYLNFPEDFPR